MFFLHAVVKIRTHVKQRYHTFCHNNGVDSPLFGNAKQPRQILKILCIGIGKCYALTFFFCHIQCIIPVCSTETDDIMFAHIIKSGKVLQ